MRAVRPVSRDRTWNHWSTQYLEAHPEVLEDCKKNPKAANRVIGHLMKETKGLYSSKDIVSCVEAEVRKRLG